MVTTLANARIPFEDYENELSAEAIEGLKAFKIEKGNEKDVLLQLRFSLSAIGTLAKLNGRREA